jgi:hypothetical protein
MKDIVHKDDSSESNTSVLLGMNERKKIIVKRGRRR